jgi:very-long-chain (3R)-3-hydroxyacyl-CoA dehydratase
MNARIEKYLKAYNLVQLAGWLLALIFISLDIDSAFFIIFFFQFISLLEVIHAHQKWTQSSPFLCIIQIGARLFILVLVKLLFFQFYFRECNYVDTLVSIMDSVIKSMFYAWCIAEIIRYAYYVTQLFKNENKTITWLRYSAFIICYPIGLTCEFFVMYTVFKHNDIVIKILMVIVAIVYVFLFPRLYLHLLKQRKLKLITNNS